MKTSATKRKTIKRNCRQRLAAALSGRLAVHLRSDVELIGSLWEQWATIAGFDGTLSRKP